VNTSIIELPGRRGRRRHTSEFKLRIVQACQQPGVSIAVVAVANGLNANMVRKWVIEAEAADGASDAQPVDQSRSQAGPVSAPVAGFIPIPALMGASGGNISVEINRGLTVVKVTWPTEAAAECAAWLRELVW
jgi:transposase